MNQVPWPLRHSGSVPCFGAMEMAELRDALSALGFEAPAPVCDEAGAADDTAERVPAQLALDWFAAAERALADPLVGLHAAQRVQPRGALVHLIMSAASLADALVYVERFSRILIDALSITQVTTDRLCSLRFAFDTPALAANAHLLDYCLLATSRVLQGAAGDACRPCAINLRHSAPARDVETYTAAFGCPVQFGGQDDALVFDKADLNAVPAIANPLVARQMEQLANALAVRSSIDATWPPAGSRRDTS